MRIKELLDRLRLLKENAELKKTIKNLEKEVSEWRERFYECDEDRYDAENSRDYQRELRHRLEDRLEEHNIPYDDIYVSWDEIIHK